MKPKAFANLINFSAIAFAVVVLLAACSSQPVYDEQITIPGHGWHKDSAVVFKPYIEEAQKPFNIELTIENTVDYNYQNLWLKYWVISPDQKVLQDSVNIFLVNQQGHWIGNFSGNVHDRRTVLQRGVGFASPGQYEFQFIQYMRKNKLKGVREIGLIIRPVAVSDTTKAGEPR